MSDDNNSTAVTITWFTYYLINTNFPFQKLDDYNILNLIIVCLGFVCFFYYVFTAVSDLYKKKQLIKIYKKINL